MAIVVLVPLPRDYRVKRIMEHRTFDSNDERDAMEFALYQFSEQDFNIVWEWFRGGGDV